MNDVVTIEPIESPQVKAVRAGMYMVRSMLDKSGRVKRTVVSINPTGVSEHTMVMVSRLLNKKRDAIGAVRVFVTAPVNGEDVKVTFEWTRNAFGFWYRKTIKLRDFVGDLEDLEMGKIRVVLDPLRWTADGSVRLNSMNRMFKKVKKNRVMDRALHSRLRTG